MSSLLRRILSSSQDRREAQKNKSSNCDSMFQEIVLEKQSEKPYILCSLYYLAVILFIGLPVWYYTCSTTRYSTPILTILENKLINTSPRLQLDISVVQVSPPTEQHDPLKGKQLEFIRKNLPDYLDTSLENVTYNLHWHIRRPTQDESLLFRSLSKAHASSPPSTGDSRRAVFDELEQSLLKIHKPSIKFRLFIFILGEPYNALVCDRPESYIINFERFVYICPGESDGSVLSSINNVLDETYRNTVDSKRIKKILNSKTDLLISLIPEGKSVDIDKLSVIADKIHNVYTKNIKEKFLELTGVVNIRLITQYVVDLLDDKKLEQMSVRQKPQPSAQGTSNSTDQQELTERKIEITDQFFHNFISRLSKHSTQSVHHVMTIVTELGKQRLTFKQVDSGTDTSVLEEKDSNFVLIGDSDKSLVLGLRAIIRRVVGLKSPNLCKNCSVRRDVFLNKWELDAIVGALTIAKLQNTLVSLRSIGQQAIGIKIPKYVSRMAHESFELALKSIDNLEARKPFEAYQSASTAFELSEAAIYDPSLLETLYFPDETKYAIYLPLFLPLAFPFSMSIVRIWKYLMFKPAVEKEKVQ